MFSFGICIFLAHFQSDVYLAPKAAHVAIPPHPDVNLRFCLEQLLARDPAMRPSADEALAMLWFRSDQSSSSPTESSNQLELFREMLRLIKTGIRGFAVKAKITPSRIIQDSLVLFQSLENQTKPLKVSFEGEKGWDQGGVTTSLYRRFFAEILADQVGEFYYWSCFCSCFRLVLFPCCFVLFCLFFFFFF